MTIHFKSLEFRNFLSFGNQPIRLDFTEPGLTVVLGLNHDTGGNESRNGVGKSAMIDAMSYALFGKTTRGISAPRMVNKLRARGQPMLCSLEFDRRDFSHRIERGESPPTLQLFSKPIDDDRDFRTLDGDDKTAIFDVSRSKPETNEDIEAILGFGFELFETLIANTFESLPFMKLSQDRKREIVEKLFGLDRLTERAEESNKKICFL